MAEEILVKEPLTQDMIVTGEKLMRVLRSEDFELAALFWLYKSELNRWRLVVASPQVDREGPKKTYATIREIRSRHHDNLPNLGPFDITVIGTSEKLVRTLAGANQHIGLSNSRWPDIYLDEEYVEDMYLYFISDVIEPLRGTSWSM